MIRFAWLQFRMQVVIAATALAITALVLILTGPSLVHMYDTTVADCAAPHNCSAATTAFTNTDGPLQALLGVFVLAAPLLIGMFWGAPLVSREFESGTLRLAWTQGVTRRRWLAVKLALGAVVSMAVAGILTIMVTWWSSHLDQVSAAPFDTLRFGARDVAPVGYAIFAFVIGVTTGLVFRRILPAMLTTLIAFVAVREIVSTWVRPHLFTPAHIALPITSSTPVSVDQTAPGVVSAFESIRGVSLPNDWIYSVKIADQAGHAPTTSFLRQACPLGNYGPLHPRDCTARLATSFHQLVTYQPGDRYWPMQWYELAIFFGVSSVLAAFCFWRIRRPVV